MLGELSEYFQVKPQPSDTKRKRRTTWHNCGFHCVPDNEIINTHNCSRSSLGTLLRILAIQKDWFNLEYLCRCDNRTAKNAYSVNLNLCIPSHDFAAEISTFLAFYTQLESILQQKLTVVLHSTYGADTHTSLSISVIPEQAELFETAIRIMHMYVADHNPAIDILDAAQKHWPQIKTLTCTLLHLLTDKNHVTWKSAPDFVTICKQTNKQTMHNLFKQVATNTLPLAQLVTHDNLAYRAIRQHFEPQPRVQLKPQIRFTIHLAKCKYLLFDKPPPNIQLWPLAAIYMPYAQSRYDFCKLSNQLTQEYTKRLTEGQYNHTHTQFEQLFAQSEQ